MADQPCDWPLDPVCPYGIETDPAARPPEQAAAVSAATEVLWRLTAGAFGLCTHTVRPCRGGCAQYNLPGTPALVDGRWLNLPCGCGRGPCSCGPLCEVRLPGPVHAIAEVKQDGEALDASAYKVQNWSYLVRTDGRCWPACQNMAASLDQPNTWGVTYVVGNPVPLGGQRALGALAAELLKACGATPGACKLPPNTVQVSREGMTIALDTTALLDAGRTGLPEVDLWLSAVNPNNLRSRPAVYSPDLPSFREDSYP